MFIFYVYNHTGKRNSNLSYIPTSGGFLQILLDTRSVISYYPICRLATLSNCSKSTYNDFEQKSGRKPVVQYNSSYKFVNGVSVISLNITEYKPSIV